LRGEFNRLFSVRQPSMNLWNPVSIDGFTVRRRLNLFLIRQPSLAPSSGIFRIRRSGRQIVYKDQG
jgi:hypothetical protein